MAEVKSRFSDYDRFFDGSVQRDAYECFQNVLRILHIGSRYCLLDSSISLGDSEEFMVSATTENFNFTFKKTLICQKCKTSSVFFIPNSAFNIYPKEGKNMHTLISESLTSSLMKGCACTNNDTNHMEILEFQEPPKILLLIMSRYDYAIRPKKNSSSVFIDKQLILNGKTYQCQAIVSHLGETTTSGHYTTKLFYNKRIYICNDYNISLSDNEETASDCSYLIFYARVN